MDEDRGGDAVGAGSGGCVSAARGTSLGSRGFVRSIAEVLESLMVFVLVCNCGRTGRREAGGASNVDLRERTGCGILDSAAAVVFRLGLVDGEMEVERGMSSDRLMGEWSS